MPQRVITHETLFGPSFYQAWNDFLDRRYTTQIFKGGRGSLKSSAISLFIILGLERDAREAMRARDAGDTRWRSMLTHGIVFRKIAADLQTSVFGQMEWAIGQLGLEDLYEIKKSPLKIVRRDTQQCILFRGLDDPIKTKSIKAPFGFYRYAWWEEVDQFDGIEEIRNTRQSVLRGGHGFQTFYSYNPPETSANWMNYYVATAAATDARTHIYHSTYLNVPREWLGEDFFAEAETLRIQNERAYRHEYLGEVTGNGGAIFQNVVARTITDEEISHFANIRWGMDFGFSLDPTAFIGLEYQKSQRRVLIFDEFYKTNMLTHEMADKCKEHHRGYQWIVCDSAAPQTIADLDSMGVPVLGAQKGPDSVKHGIRFLQSQNEIVIDPARCPETFREFSLYEYDKNRAGQFISRYPDRDNHSIDAVRYALEEDSIGAGLF